MMQWQFVCPGCGANMSVQDYKDAGASEGAIGFSCIGRFADAPKSWMRGEYEQGGGCDYIAGGLFNISPVTILDGENTYRRFAYAPIEYKQGEPT